MFRLYQHHDAAALAALLAALRERADPRPPLTPDTIIVPNRGTARWLQAELAASEGSATNLELPLIGRFVWQVLQATLPGLPDSSDYERERMVWHLYALLPVIDVPAVRHYLAGEPREIHRYQLALRLADAFDQYMVHRRDMLAAWEAGEEAAEPPANWQAPVWRALVQRLGPRHRARLLTEFLQHAAAGDIDASRLPDPLHAFAPGDLPVDYLRLLHALGQRIDVHFLLCNPSAAWWGDLRRRPVAPAALAGDSAAEAGHPLLASLGRAGGDFLQILHDDAFSDIHEPELGADLAPSPPAATTLLARVQADVIAGSAPVRADGAGKHDRSIRIHACHGPLREAQVLHDHLLDLLAERPDLQPRDILVLLPDVSRHAPAIRSVFDAATGGRHIPYRIADRPRLDSHPVAHTFRRLIDLPLARWTAGDVLGLAGVPAVMRRFGLDPGDLDMLHQWVAEAGVRWGLDAESRAAAGAAAFEQNSWRFGLDRLLLGLAQADDSALVDGVAPWSGLEGGPATAVGRLWQLLDRLRHWGDRLAETASAAVWHERLNALIRDLFAPDPDDPDEAAALATVIEATSVLETADDCLHREPLSREAAREVLLGALAGSAQRQPLVSGGVTFAGLEPLRGVPFRVVCMLGMDDGVFPRQDGDREFNALRRHPRVGDPSLRDTDRMIFLQSLMAARDCFHVSYTGRDATDGAELQPSPVIGELIDFLHGYYFAGRDREEVQSALSTRQPLHPFSPRYFEARHADLFTFVDDWRQAALAIAGPRTTATGFVDDTELPAPDPAEPIELADLLAFYAHPPRWFFHRCLRLELDARETVPPEEEPLALDALEQHLLRQRLFARARAADAAALDTTRPDALERARGRLPPPPLGSAEYAAAAADVNAVLPAWYRWRAVDAGTGVDIDLALADGVRLRGRVEDVGTHELLNLRPAQLRLKHKLPAWLAWLAVVAAGNEIHLRLVGASNGEAEHWLARTDAATARGLLQAAVDHYRAGQQRPLLFEPYVAEHYLGERARTTRSTGAPKTPAEALDSTNGWLNNTWQPPAARRDPWLQPLFGESPAPLGTDARDSPFVAVCEAVARPLTEHLVPPESGS